MLGTPDDLTRIIQTEKAHLVLLDLLFPGSDGIELLQQVPELPDPPVIFISAYRRDETVAQALEAGAADYIAKPFSPTGWWRGRGRRSEGTPNRRRSCSERSPPTTRTAG